MDPQLFNLEDYAKRLAEAYCVKNAIPITRKFTDNELAGPLREIEAAKRQLEAA